MNGNILRGKTFRVTQFWPDGHVHRILYLEAETKDDIDSRMLSASDPVRWFFGWHAEEVQLHSVARPAPKVHPLKGTKHECDNCENTFYFEDLEHQFPDIPDILNRIDPGNTVPSGTCPECGCLTYLIKN